MESSTSLCPKNNFQHCDIGCRNRNATWRAHSIAVCMTLVLSINGPDIIWIVADKRLSFADGRISDSARKIAVIETGHDVALLGYSGLGVTAAGVEPADWIISVLRSRTLSIEKSLEAIANATARELPNHLKQLYGVIRRPLHNMLVPAFVDGEARLYSIDIQLSVDGREYQTRFVRHFGEKKQATVRKTPRLGATGSGSVQLLSDKRWIRPLLRLVRAVSNDQLSPIAVADQLAKLCHDVHLLNPTVGPSSVVVWRRKRNSGNGGGGAHQDYLGGRRVGHASMIPMIGGGMDLNAIVKSLLPSVIAHFSQPSADVNKSFDAVKINENLSKLPSTPDETLK